MLSFCFAVYMYANVLPERNSLSKLRHVYKNGADSSNLKISWIQKCFKFLWLFNQHVMSVSVSFSKSLFLPVVLSECWIDEPIINSEMLEIPYVLLTLWSMGFPWDLRIVNINLYVWQKAARQHPFVNWTWDATSPGEDDMNPKIGLATKRISRHWSVVSCVRCGCVGAGLGFPVGNLRFFSQPPTLKAGSHGVAAPQFSFSGSHFAARVDPPPRSPALIVRSPKPLFCILPIEFFSGKSVQWAF